MKRELLDKIINAPTNRWIRYHHGCLLADRTVNKMVDAAARAAWQAAKDGYCVLVQQRNGAGCDYFAVRL